MSESKNGKILLILVVVLAAYLFATYNMSTTEIIVKRSWCGMGNELTVSAFPGKTLYVYIDGSSYAAQLMHGKGDFSELQINPYFGSVVADPDGVTVSIEKEASVSAYSLIWKEAVIKNGDAFSGTGRDVGSLHVATPLEGFVFYGRAKFDLYGYNQSYGTEDYIEVKAEDSASE